MTFKVKRPAQDPYPERLETIGNHLRAFRLSNELSREEMAERLGVKLVTYCGWDRNSHNPHPRWMPKIIKLIGKDCLQERPQTLSEKVKQHRLILGLSQEKCAEAIGIKPQILGDLERCARKTQKKTLLKVKAFLQRTNAVFE